MYKIKNLFITPECLSYLEKRNLINQFKKAKSYLLSNQAQKTRFKERMPKGSGVFYFRINKQFRAIGYFDNYDLIITKIDNHQ